MKYEACRGCGGLPIVTLGTCDALHEKLAAAGEMRGEGAEATMGYVAAAG
jgi:hypothetical protein